MSRISEPLRGFIRHQTNRAYIDGGQTNWLTNIADKIDERHEKARDYIYNAGFDNGIKATLQQLDELLINTDDAMEIQAWVDEQWNELDFTLAQDIRQAADTIEGLRERLQDVRGECDIEWRDDSHDTDCGHEHDGAYFCTSCGKDLPYPLQEAWDDYQALVADYGNVPPWDKQPFNCCPSCGAKVRKAVKR